MDTKSYSLAWQDLALWRGDRCLQTGLNGKLGGGQALTVRGPNGCGKTTLLRTLCGLSEPETGQILWQAQPVHRNRSDFHANLAYAGHANGLKGELTTRENLRFNAQMRGRHTNQNELLHWLGLTRCADLPVHNLSAGQRRRAALARVLGSGAQLWILDEPFTNLDAAGMEWLGSRFNHHLSLGGLLMIAAHQDSRIEPGRESLLELSGTES
jgi:heme exporter protein A